MLDTKKFRKQVKDFMGPVFEKEGFKYKYEGSAPTWIKNIENGDYHIGIGLFIDSRVKTKPEYRLTLFVDMDDIRDIRAYSHSGWPPKSIEKRLGIKVSLINRVFSGGYDAWIPVPDDSLITPAILEEYAEYLVKDLYSKVEKGKKWVRKTHRWEYDG